MLSDEQIAQIRKKITASQYPIDKEVKQELLNALLDERDLLLGRMERAEEVVVQVMAMDSVNMGDQTEVDTERWEKMENLAVKAYLKSGIQMCDNCLTGIKDREPFYTCKKCKDTICAKCFSTEDDMCTLCLIEQMAQKQEKTDS